MCVRERETEREVISKNRRCWLFTDFFFNNYVYQRMTPTSEGHVTVICPNCVLACGDNPSTTLTLHRAVQSADVSKALRCGNRLINFSELELAETSGHTSSVPVFSLVPSLFSFASPVHLRSECGRDEVLKGPRCSRATVSWLQYLHRGPMMVFV